MPNRTSQLNQMESPFEVQELFFSLTDQNGVIRHGNNVFARVSEYSLDELIGTAHSIIRHPDMPRVVFKLLWETIERGETIAAYVKNRTQHGRYYWVLAVAMPCEGGYLSVRLKPTSGLLQTVEELYGDLRQIELEIEAGEKQRPAAMAASRKALTERLNSLGFPTYNDFMRHALSVEMQARASISRRSSAKLRSDKQ
ncbi:MAG: PAS domain-containing protein [Pirellulaceae bacterium]